MIRRLSPTGVMQGERIRGKLGASVWRKKQHIYVESPYREHGVASELYQFKTTNIAIDRDLVNRVTVLGGN
jgi:hypothetical protein